MKRRKPPVLLATCLVLMLVAVGIFFSPKGSGDDGHGHGEQQAANTPPPPAAEKGDRPKVSAGQVANMAKTAIAAPKTALSEGKPGRPGSGPSIAATKPSNYKPTPNDSSTSTQWYTDQTGKK